MKSSSIFLIFFINKKSKSKFQYYYGFIRFTLKIPKRSDFDFVKGYLFIACYIVDL